MILNKFLLIAGSINQGGAEFQLLSLARLLQSKGLDVEVLALTDYDYYIPFIVEHNIKYSCVSNKGNDLQRLQRAIRQINSKRPDLVISYIKKTSQVAILARVLSGFRFKLIISERTSLVKPWHDLFYFNLALLANRLTVNSISKYNYILKRFPLLKGRTVFIPNIIDIKKYSAVERTKSEPGNVRLSYIGRISPEKNLLNLIKAIRLVIEKRYNISLSLIGQANNKCYLQEMNQLIQDLSLTEIVKYKGSTNDVTEVYSNTDLLCLVSFYEGFSNVLSEAISCGIPVVASNIDENRFLVEDMKNGFLVDSYKPASIAGGIERFLKLNQHQIEMISTNNRKDAFNNFNEDYIYQSYNELFSKLISKESL